MHVLYYHTYILITCAYYINSFIGILAGIWPCGVITIIRELFIAESKSQVYGHLHQFLQNTSLLPGKMR